MKLGVRAEAIRVRQKSVVLGQIGALQSVQGRILSRRMFHDCGFFGSNERGVFNILWAVAGVAFFVLSCNDKKDFLKKGGISSQLFYEYIFF